MQQKKIYTDTFKNFYQDNIDDANNRENTNDKSDFLFNILGGNNNNDYNEAEAYLQQPVASIKTDPLTWWKVNCIATKVLKTNNASLQRLQNLCIMSHTICMN